MKDWYTGLQILGHKIPAFYDANLCIAKRIKMHATYLIFYIKKMEKSNFEIYGILLMIYVSAW